MTRLIARDDKGAAEAAPSPCYLPSRARSVLDPYRETLTASGINARPSFAVGNPTHKNEMHPLAGLLLSCHRNGSSLANGRLELQTGGTDVSIFHGTSTSVPARPAAERGPPCSARNQRPGPFQWVRLFFCAICHIDLRPAVQDMHILASRLVPARGKAEEFPRIPRHPIAPRWLGSGTEGRFHPAGAS
jgi:hypothetical protein